MKRLICFSICFFSLSAFSQPFKISEKLFDFDKPNLGLSYAKGAETILVYKAQKSVSQYNHGAILFAHNEQLYVQWQSSKRDEDAADTRVLYSVSSDGVKWSAATVLAPARKNAIVTSGGWWSDGKKLIAFLNVWPKTLAPRGGYVEAIESVDGATWSSPKRLTFHDGRSVNGILEQDLHRLKSGRVLTAVHQQPGLKVKPMYTDDSSALSGWKLGSLDNLPFNKPYSRALEPSNFQRKDGSIVMIFRDQRSTFKILASESTDNANNWHQASLTNMPDSRAKQSAGNLPSGTVFIVNNPSRSKSREPLTVTLSKDGRKFDRAFLLREGGEKLEGPKYEGKYKRRGFSYPKSFVAGEYLYVAYAENKEDIKITRVPLPSLD